MLGMHTCIQVFRYVCVYKLPIILSKLLTKLKIKLGPRDPLLPSSECSPHRVNHSVCDIQCTFCKQHIYLVTFENVTLIIDLLSRYIIYHFFKPPSVKGEAVHFPLMNPRCTLLFVHFAEEQSKDLQVEQASKSTRNYTLNELFVPGWSPLIDQASIPFENSLFRKGVAGTGGNKLTEIW